jgi:hypothetical protein
VTKPPEIPQEVWDKTMAGQFENLGEALSDLGQATVADGCAYQPSSSRF